jgi:hypothetical protein
MSAEENNGLTLEGVAQRLEALERENERMRSENAELRDEVAELRGSGTPRGEVPALRGSDRRPDKEVASEFAGQVSRRALLSKAGAAAVAAVAAGTLLNPREAKADHNGPGIEVDFVRVHRSTPGFGVSSISEQGPGVYGQTNSSIGSDASGVYGLGNGTGAFGVIGAGVVGVEGRGNGGAGVSGVASGTGGVGVYGRNSSPSGSGVGGEGKGIGNSGIFGRGLNGADGGVFNAVGSGNGVVADGNGADRAGVLGRNSTGTGVQGESAENGYAGVYGLHTGTLGYGVYGLAKGSRTAGVLGRHQGAGYGGQFEGGRAQLWLVPKSTAGNPTSGAHTKGEIYMDSAANLFVCTANGTPGTWRRVTTTAV